MAKKTLYCEDCDVEYALSYKCKEEPTSCPFCGGDVDCDWNSIGLDDDGED